MAKFQQLDSAIKNTDKALQDLEKRLEGITQDVLKLDKAIDKNSTSQSNLSKTTKQLSVVEKELQRIDKARQKLAPEIVKEQVKLAEARKKAREEAKKELGITKQNISFTKKLTNAFKVSLIQITAAIAAFRGLINAGKAYIDNIKTLNKNISQTAATFQLTREQAEGLTKQIRGVAAAFDKDFNDVLKASNILAKEFGITGSNALALIEDGFKKGADVNGEFLEILKEYPAQLRTVGLNAKQTISLIAQTEQQGLFSDKGIDAIKEAGIRLRELTPATKEALNAIGLSGDEIQKQLTTGEKTLFEVTQEVSSKLSELPPQSKEVGTAIADIFGGPGEDVGLRFLTTLKDINLELEDIETMISPVEESSATLKRNWQGLKDEVTKGDGAASKFLATIQNGISQNIGFLTNLFNGFEDVRKGNEESTEEQKESQQELTETTNIESEARIKIAQEEAAKRKSALEKFLKQASEFSVKLAAETDKTIQEFIGVEPDQFQEWENIIKEIEAEVEDIVENDNKLVEDSIKAQNEAKLAGYEEDLEAYSEYLQRKSELEKSLASEAEQAVSTIITDQFNAREDEKLAKFKDGQKAQEDALKNRLDKGLISESQYERELKKIRLKTRQEEAKAEKKKALFDIGINTALGIVKTIGTAGFPAAIPLIAAVAAIGAIQAAAVAAKPIPKFKTGTKGKLNEGTFAVVGDGFEHELITTPQGDFLSDNKPQTVWLPKNSEVFSGADTKELMQENKSNILNLEPLIKEQKATRAAILNQKQKNVNITDKGMKMYIKSSGNELEYINKYCRHTV